MSRSPVGAVAEFLRDLRPSLLEDGDLRWEGNPHAVAAIDDASLTDLLDLDDPRNLLARELRPSAVATRHRRRTQPIARTVFEEGFVGFEWWSTIEASWINVTLFADRAAARVSIVGEPEPLTLDHPAVRQAADAVGVLMA